MLLGVLLILLPLQAPDDLARGKKLFESQCALCHGQTGLGGRGPSLARPVLRRAADDKALVKLIQEGVPGSEMDGAWQMSEREVQQVAAYVRSLGRIPKEVLTGDPARGQAVYRKEGCANCHIVAGEGTGFGPELTGIGDKRSTSFLRDHLTEPEKTLPDGFMMVRATTRAGKTISGARINEDSFTIQMQDATGHFYSFQKRDLGSLTKLPGKSPMPSFRSLPPAELDDLIAYLAGLRGKP